MELQFDINKEYALSLMGGGARGAYQIGAWKAIKEAGFKIKAVAGTSVGALNGALVAMGDLEKAVGIWQELSYSNVIEVDDKLMSEVMNKKQLQIIKSKGKNEIKDAIAYGKEILGQSKDIYEQGKDILANKGFDTTPLRKMIEKYIDPQKVIDSDIEFITVICMPYWEKHQDTAGTKPGLMGYEKNVSNRELKEEELVDYLLASSNLPVFKNQKLNGENYIDGGYVNVRPDNVLLERGYENIISIRLPSSGVIRKANYVEPPIIIEPRGKIGGVIEFENSKIRENIELGYYDAMKVLYGLEGFDYYFDVSICEDETSAFFTKHGREFCEMFEEVYTRRKRERLNSIIPSVIFESTKIFD
ncbi:MAG: patatin-like phospholipase family protein [Lachnospiraceae bacterium]|nr:patatin-like phospholipase family protein [Lachnospiraceae bacterium]